MSPQVITFNTGDYGMFVSGINAIHGAPSSDSESSVEHWNDHAMKMYENLCSHDRPNLQLASDLKDSLDKLVCCYTEDIARDTDPGDKRGVFRACATAFFQLLTAATDYHDIDCLGSESLLTNIFPGVYPWGSQGCPRGILGEEPMESASRPSVIEIAAQQIVATETAVIESNDLHPPPQAKVMQPGFLRDSLHLPRPYRRLRCGFLRLMR